MLYIPKMGVTFFMENNSPIASSFTPQFLILYKSFILKEDVTTSNASLDARERIISWLESCNANVNG